MPKFQKLVALRSQYPSTTSAAHSLLMRAADLQRNDWFAPWGHGEETGRALLAFEQALCETIEWASRETGDTEPAKVLAFLKVYFAKFFDACPNCQISQEEIEARLFGSQEAGITVVRQVLKYLECGRDGTRHAR